ncbi:MAG: hypothetical protein ACREPI_12350 [Candidatus Dormibacterales bacterium]
MPPLAWVALGVTMGWIAVEIAARQLVGALRRRVLTAAWAVLSAACVAVVVGADYVLLVRAGEPLWGLVVAAGIVALYLAWLLWSAVALILRRRAAG